MLIFKKEKAVRKLALEHATLSHNCVKAVQLTLAEYVSNDTPGLQANALRVSQLESQADTLKRDAREVLQSGAFLPAVRSDVYRLIEHVDKVAGGAEDLARFLIGQSPTIPPAFHTRFVEIMDLTVNCSGEMRKALHAYFKPKGIMKTLDKHVARVGQLESDVDGRQLALMQDIFAADTELATKIHLGQLLSVLCAMSNAAESVADELKFAALKSVV